MGFKAAVVPRSGYNAPRLGAKFDFLEEELASDTFGYLGPLPRAYYPHYLPLIGVKALFAPLANINNPAYLVSLLGLTEQALATAPANIGNSMPTKVVDGRYIYLPQGFSASGTPGTGFYRYDLYTDAWATLAAITTLNAGYRFWNTTGCLWDGGDYIYVLGVGDAVDYDKLFRYSISGDSWAELTDAPSNISSGGGCEGPIGGFIYALRGGSVTDFYRYSISGDSWATLTAAPGAHATPGLVQSGADANLLYAIGGSGGTGRIHRYSISGDAWTTLTGTNIPGEMQGKGVFFTIPSPLILQYRRTTTQLWVYKV